MIRMGTLFPENSYTRLCNKKHWPRRGGSGGLSIYFSVLQARQYRQYGIEVVLARPKSTVVGELSLEFKVRMIGSSN